MALSTKTLDALNDSRKTEPHKYIWGQFTPDKDGVGYSDLPEQTDIPDDAKLVLDVNGPSLVTASITSIRGGLSGRIATTEKAGIVKPDGTTISVSSDGTISSSALATKVNKAGDTMTGPLKMSGQNQIRFGTDDNFYIVKKEEGTNNLILFGKDNTGLFLDSGTNSAPHYWNGTTVYRLLTMADLETLQTQINSLNTEVMGMLGRMNYNARVDFNLSHGQSYTVPSKGYLWINRVSGNSAGGTAYINGGVLVGASALSGGALEGGSSLYVMAFVPVSAGDVLSASRSDKNSTVFVSGFFVPQI